MANIWNVAFMIISHSSGLTLYGMSDAGIFQEPFTLTCNTSHNNAIIVIWTKESTASPLAVITGGYSNGSCKFDGDATYDYTFTCDPVNSLYNMTISRTLMTNVFHMTQFRCTDLINNIASNIYTLYINIPVFVASLVSTPNDENPVKLNETAPKTFECKTKAIRPSATINWFIGTANVTYLGKTTTVDIGHNLVMSSSIINYTGKRNDNNNILYCTATNIGNSVVIKSDTKILQIQYGPDKVLLSPSTQSYTVNETTDSVGPISCSADCIPNCSVKWSGSNIPTGTTSVLNIQNTKRNQSGDYQCTASNVVSSMQSIIIRVIVQYGPGKVLLSPSSQSYAVNETTDSVGPINCTADCIPNCLMKWSGPNIPTGTTSILSIHNIKRNQSGDYQCTASNVVSSMQSIITRVIVQYGPGKVLLSPSTQSYTVNETTDSVGPISCTADCIPNCLMKWSGPKISTGTTSILNIQNINRNQSGDYQCTASNVVSSMQSILISVIVQYKPYITPLSGNLTAEENDRVVIECMVDSSPDSKIEWIFNNISIHNQQNFDIELLGKRSSNVQSSQLIIHRTECLMMGNYSCQALNILGFVFTVASLTVNCEPRVNTIEFDVPTTVTIGDSQPINLTVQIIAYPGPIIYWTFNANSTSVNVTTDITNKFMINRHTSNLFIGKPDDKNMGQYIIYAYNFPGRVNTIHSFNVIPERRPDFPGNVICEGELNYVTVHWISGFNGGRQQNFSVYYSEHVSDIANDFKEYDIITDKGQGKIISAKIYPLFPGKGYSFEVIARNVHGFSKSEAIVCNTTTASVEQENTNSQVSIGLFAAGISGLILTLIFFAAFISLRLHKSRKMSNRQKTYVDLGTMANSSQDAYTTLTDVSFSTCGTNNKRSEQCENIVQTCDKCSLPPHHPGKHALSNWKEKQGSLKKKSAVYANMKV